MFAATAATDRAAGDILIMDGRRYKVASVGNTPSGVAAKITLTETYAGGMIYEECTSCVTEIAATAITSSRTITTAIGEGFMVEGYTNINQDFSQCSNRGACDSSTGVCKCFKGYSNDNCDTQ